MTRNEAGPQASRQLNPALGGNTGGGVCGLRLPCSYYYLQQLTWLAATGMGAQHPLAMQHRMKPHKQTMKANIPSSSSRSSIANNAVICRRHFSVTMHDHELTRAACRTK